MAEVYLAEATGPQGFSRQVALKVVLPGQLDRPEIVKMFLEEAHVAAQFAHPNIVQIYDFGEFEGRYFMAMEYCRGISLRVLGRKLRGKRARVPDPIIAAVGSQVFSALAYAHSRTTSDGVPMHVVHRDVTPENILLCAEGTAKILDFGIAKSAVRLSDETMAGMVKGKPAYMSPEQCAGFELDGRSDVFSTGSTLWEALTGARLFDGTDLVAVVTRVATEYPRDPRSVVADVGNELADALMSSLERDLQRRPAAGEMQRIFDGLLHRMGVANSQTAIAAFLKGEIKPTPLLKVSADAPASSSAPHAPGAATDERGLMSLKTNDPQVGDAHANGAHTDPGFEVVPGRPTGAGGYSDRWEGTGENEVLDLGAPLEESPFSRSMDDFAPPAAGLEQHSPSEQSAPYEPPAPYDPPSLPQERWEPSKAKSAERRSDLVRDGGRGRFKPRSVLVPLALLLIFGGAGAWFFFPQLRPFRAPPPSAAPQQISVRFDSAPPGAAVEVDGVATGLRTPAMLSLAPDDVAEHRYRLLLADHEAVEGSFRAKGAMPPSHKLVPISALVVESEPSGARVRIGGRVMAVTPARLPLGREPREVVIELDGFVPVVRAYGGSEQVESWKIALAPAAWLDLRSNTPGAMILVDGKPTGLKAPHERVPVEAMRPHTLTLRAGKNLSPARTVRPLAPASIEELRVDFPVKAKRSDEEG